MLKRTILSGAGASRTIQTRTRTFVKIMTTKQSVPADERYPQASEPLPENFETALAELEALVERMEGGELGLDESIRAYERGAALAQVCRQRLDAAEQQVAVLQENLLRPLTDPEGDGLS